MRLEWSDEALADLDRFVEFLHRQHPSLAATVASEIISKVQVLISHPRLGRPLPGERNIGKSSCRFSVPPMYFSIALMVSAS
jgi:plasmid stabilization system protein ParE